MNDTHEITKLLAEGRNDDEAVFERLLPLIYEPLRAMAHRQLRLERPDHTLGTTALVHEAYLKLVDQRQTNWKDRGHFYAIAARAMRRILVDHARKNRAEKRGGGRVKIDIESVDLPIDEHHDRVLALDEALTRLSRLNERLVRVVECRFFGGLNVAETADALGVTTRTVRRDWVKARGWLYRELAGEPGP